MKSVCYRQGDVFLIPVSGVPVHGSRKSRSGVLAEGEVTGHAHRIKDPYTADVFTIEGQLYVEVREDQAAIVHEEHGPITLPRGAYMVRIQREYTPQGIQKVHD